MTTNTLAAQLDEKNRRIAELEDELKAAHDWCNQVGEKNRELIEMIAGYDTQACRLAAKAEQIEAQLTQAQAGAWEPLPDGRYLDGALAIAFNGSDIGIKVDDGDYKGDDWVCNYEWLSDCEIHDIRTKDEKYRVCRWHARSES